MEFLQSILNNSTMPLLSAFLLGLLTALSPCPLATNIAAIGYIGKDMENKRVIFRNGLLYTLGRTLAYTILGVILILVLKQGASMFGIQRFIGKYGEMILGPMLLLFGLFILFGHRLNLPSFGFKGDGEKVARRGGWGALLLGILFALAFCPSSGIFYFGMLIPMSATLAAGYFLPMIFAVATSLPVVIVAWFLSFSANKIGVVYGKMQAIQKWFNNIVGILFIVIGIYFCITIYF